MDDAPEPVPKRRTILRLKRIGGQIDGIVRMIEEERLCLDVLTQISAVQAALFNVGVEVLEHDLQDRVAGTLDTTDPAARKAALSELVELLARSSSLLR